MRFRQALLTASLLAPILSLGPAVSAEEIYDYGDEHRQHGAHMHGIAAFTLVLEGQEVQIELDSPAANILGFEHAPSSEADHATLDNAVAVLKDGDRLFSFSDDAGCRMVWAKVASDLLDEDQEGSSGGHAHESEGETHSDIEAAYHFECNAPGKLARLSVKLFEAFQGLEALKVEYVAGEEQGAAELTGDDPVLHF